MALRHDRRRRVLTDDMLAGAETPSETTGSQASVAAAESYAVAARREQQPHVVDLVPLGWLGQTLFLLTGVTIVAGLEVVYTMLPDWRANLGDESLAALDLAGPGSLAHWFSSMLLAWAAGLGWLIYRLRSHRIDDYRGRYRVWWLLAPATLILSVNEIAPLERLGAGLAKLALSGFSISHERWWVLGCAGCWLALAGRAMFETWRSRGATFVLALATLQLLLAATAGEWLTIKLNSAEGVMLLGGLRMGGHLLLFCAASLYARHVILDAEGRIKPRAKAAAAPKRKRREKPVADEAEPATPSAKTAANVDPPQKPRGPVNVPRTDLDPPRVAASVRPTARPEPADRPTARPSVVERGSADDDDSDDDDSQNQYAGLTRAERKRLKRQQRQGRAD
jgi:hypothetical protein